MRQDNGVPLAFELLQFFREIDASAPNAFGAEIYTRPYPRLIWWLPMDLQI
jgi:hypothetical protein